MAGILSASPSITTSVALAPTAPPPSNRRAGKLGARNESRTARRIVRDELTVSASAAKNPAQLSPEEREVVDQLAARDREVRAHEQAHLTAAGPYARGGPTYTFQTGPDGRNYAVGGQVQIDTSPVKGDPEATIAKAQVVRAAALAPAKPSAQDRKVAATASRVEQQARIELREREQTQNKAPDPSSDERPDTADPSFLPTNSGSFGVTTDAGQFLDLIV